jgi:hypothetical protein
MKPKADKPADLETVGALLVEASRLSNHKEFVIIGSLSVLATGKATPSQMLMSMDVDLYPRLDPGRAGEIARALGPDSRFAQERGLYADAVSPHLAALPEGWEARLVRVEHPAGVIGHYLDPNDCAVAKLARSETRDLRWVRQGIAAGIIDPTIVERRMASAPFLDQAEHDRAKRNLSDVARRAQALNRKPSLER